MNESMAARGSGSSQQRTFGLYTGLCPKHWNYLPHFISTGLWTWNRQGVPKCWLLNSPRRKPIQTKTFDTTLSFFLLFSGHAAQCGLWPPRLRGYLITHNNVPRSVELLWTSDHLVAETSTWQHTTHTTDKHACSRWESNPRSQQTSGRWRTP
jgi:hypothetical protein